MTSDVLISHSPEDRETATYLASDLERQGIRAGVQQPGDEQAVVGAAAVIAVISDASAASRQVWTEADRAARIGKPLYVVRLSEVSGEAFAAMPVKQWTDAFGPQAQANVAHFAAALRLDLAAAAAQPKRSDPASGHAPHQPPRSGGLPAYRIVLGIAGVIGIAAGAFSLYQSGVFGGRSSSASSSSAPTRPMPVTAPVSTPSRVATNSTRITPQALAGRWGFSPGCTTGGVIIYMADGRWGVEGNAIDGTYSLSGDRKTSTDRYGITTRATVERFDGQNFVWRKDDGGLVSNYRC